MVRRSFGRGWVAVVRSTSCLACMILGCFAMSCRVLTCGCGQDYELMATAKCSRKAVFFDSTVTMGSTGSRTYVRLIKLLRPMCICCFKACVVKEYGGRVDGIVVNTSCRDDCQWLLQMRRNQTLQYGIHPKNVPGCISS